MGREWKRNVSRKGVKCKRNGVGSEWERSWKGVGVEGE